MQRDGLLATIERLSDTEYDALGRDELAATVADIARVRGWLDALELRCTRRGALADAMPTFEQGLGAGRVSAAHLDAIANANRHAPADVLVAAIAAAVPAGATGTRTDSSITEDGTPLPVSTIRRLCCDADIVPVVLGGAGETLDVGRTRRTIDRAHRRALRAMHRTCAEPHCTVPYSHCKIHHIRWWWRDRGATDIANLLRLRERHHHLAHDGGWSLTMTADRIATWTRPDGTIHHCGSTIDRRTGHNSVLSPRVAH